MVALLQHIDIYNYSRAGRESAGESTGGTSASSGTWKFWLVWTVVGCRRVLRASHRFELFIMGGV